MAGRKFFILSACLIIICLSKVSAAHDQFIEVIAKAKPAVVIIEVTRSKKKLKPKEEFRDLGESADFFEKDLEVQPRRSRASGFIVELNTSNNDILNILTAAHVVKGVSKVKVLFSDGRRKDASINWLSVKDDVALLEVDMKSSSYGALTLSEQYVVEGQSVLSIAGSFDLSVSSSLGIISAVNVTLPSKKKLKLIQTDAVINPGSSGGALLDSDGHVVGLISNIYTKTGTFSGTAFAIPSLKIKEIIMLNSKHLHLN